MESKKILNHSIFKVSNNRFLLANKYELDIIFYMISND